jgi:hypothetical protein
LAAAAYVTAYWSPFVAGAVLLVAVFATAGRETVASANN